ncbi:terpene synthase family protein [Kitasatospora sp. NPDC093806]|uniref:terpene synthase family protein n=1 Tax=Kitasatospora sp. NPDC093806 TaxID=3155075 RepID=UPI00343F8353
MNTAALLAPYEPVLACPERRALAAALLDEALAGCTCGRGAAWHARESVYSAVFEFRCSPADATFAERLAAARYVELFFLVDDGPPAEARALAGRLRAGAVGLGDSEPARQADALLAGLRARGLPTDRLADLLADFCAAVAEESDGPPPPERSHPLRMDSIGTRPYIECWRLLRGLPVPPPGSVDHRLMDATVEAVYLANDLLSAAAEEHVAEQAQGNTVLARARATGDRAGATEAAVTRYNHLTAALTAARERPFPSLLGRVVDGNRASYRDLATTRYPGMPLDLFHRLHLVTRPTD